jgi:hypothetical protein
MKTTTSLTPAVRKIAADDRARYISLEEGRKKIKMGLKWLTADKLGAFGVRELFAHFPADILPGDYTGVGHWQHADRGTE